MNDSRAFSLVELLVSVGIISLISAVVFFNYPQFNESTALNRSARELTLAFREAQTRAIAVAPLPDGIFPKNYGVFIDSTNPGGNGKFLIFSDTDNDKKYLASGDVLIKTFTFTRGIKIISGGDQHFIYYRPGPKMIVSDSGGTCLYGDEVQCDASMGPFIIKITGADGNNSRTIEIWRTGQISIR